jgi:hypothetical protein
LCFPRTELRVRCRRFWNQTRTYRAHVIEQEHSQRGAVRGGSPGARRAMPGLESGPLRDAPGGEAGRSGGRARRSWRRWASGSARTFRPARPSPPPLASIASRSARQFARQVACSWGSVNLLEAAYLCA